MEWKSVDKYEINRKLNSFFGYPNFEVIKMNSRNESILDGSIDNPISEDVYPVIDTDLARDNLENDMPAADLQDL